ncbi:hypothetical protein [Streptomyces avicenniae]|uniref:hypothetical protein n=1 Tax=Streptomyces avicenniae TaxID=500153 RepID=UPI00069B9221|nr:hypothetical protein [Streptomyces avicenniae]
MDEENGRGRLDLYVETLRARMPAAEFIGLMSAFHAWRGAPHAAAPAADAGAPLTPEAQSEMLALMRLTSAHAPAAPPAPRTPAPEGLVTDLGHV